ncbi:MAG TPA: hypothetical protein VNL71_13920 [Chloroflexota bacterium]|nr:hypothetical protein [Chloroflexota bacterium]
MPQQLDESEAQAKLQSILNQQIPGAAAQEIAVRPGFDADGDESLFVKVVFREWPDSADSRRRNAVADDFRSWLITAKADERFPYFDFTTEKDELEIGAD